MRERGLPGIGAAPWPKGGETPTAWCVRRYERHPDPLLFAQKFLFCVLRFDLITIVVTKKLCALTLQLLFWNLILSFSIVFLFVREIQVSLRLIVTENFFLSKFIYYCLYVFQKTVFYGFLVCFPFDFLSSVLVLQVFKARFGLIRPTAVTGPFCLKS